MLDVSLPSGEANLIVGSHFRREALELTLTQEREHRRVNRI